MVTLYYVATSRRTYHLRHSLKAVGMKYDATQKHWWGSTQGEAEAACGIIGCTPGCITEVQAQSYPKGKPRGRPFVAGSDTRRTVEPSADTSANAEPSDAEPEPDSNSDTAQQLAALVRKLASGTVDMRQVEELVTRRMAEQAEALAEQLAKVAAQVAGAPRDLRITVDGLPAVQIGLAHRDLERIVRRCSIRNADGTRRFPNVRVVGPAGSGKTTLAAQLAEALGLSFTYMSATRSMPESRLEGKRIQNIMTGEEKYVPSSLVGAYTEPALYLLDEADNLDGSAAVCVNMATGNGHWALPDGTVLTRHPDMVFLLAMNTWGNGQDRQYMREQQDAAFLDRFSGASFYIGYDESLETALTGVRDDVRSKFYSVRKAAEGKVRRILSSRMLFAAHDVAVAEKLPADAAIRETMPDWSAADLAAVGL